MGKKGPLFIVNSVAHTAHTEITSMQLIGEICMEIFHPYSKFQNEMTGFH